MTNQDDSQIELQLVLEHTPNKNLVQALDRALENDILKATNAPGPRETRSELAVWLKSSNGDVYGGLWGWTLFGWLYIDSLWILDSLRGSGFGSKLMEIAEEEARKRGCHSARLETMSFQARPFYEKRGYRLNGELPNYPYPHTLYYLVKTL